VEAARRLRRNDLIPKYQKEWMKRGSPWCPNHLGRKSKGVWGEVGVTWEKKIRNRKRTPRHQLTPPVMPSIPETQAPTPASMEWDDEFHDERGQIEDIVGNLLDRISELEQEVERMKRSNPSTTPSGELESQRHLDFQPVRQMNGTRPSEPSTQAQPTISTCETANAGNVAAQVPEQGGRKEGKKPEKPEPMETEPTPPGPVEPAKEEPTEEEPETFSDLLDEFENWIYMRTQGMKRSKAYLVMLPNLMQRWLKLKKIESYPKDFIDGLMEACYERVKPSPTEMGLADKLANPETRFEFNTFNEALDGEVSVVNERKREAWVQQRAHKVWLWWLTFFTGYYPAGFIRLPFPQWWTTWLLGMVWWLFLNFPRLYWGDDANGEPIMWYDPPVEFWTPTWLAVVLNHMGLLTTGRPLMVGWMVATSAFTIIQKFLTVFTWYTYFGVLRRAYFRGLFTSGAYIGEGYFKSGLTIKSFDSGNGKSR